MEKSERGRADSHIGREESRKPGESLVGETLQAVEYEDLREVR